MSALLEVKNLSVEFPTRRGTLKALDDVSFTIAPGEVLGVVRVRRGQVVDRRRHHRPARAARAHQRGPDPAGRAAHRQPAAKTRCGVRGREIGRCSRIR